MKESNFRGDREYIMTIEELLNKLKNLTYRTNDGYEINVINTVNFNRVEQLIRQYALDNHDSEYGELQGKLWAYEQIIQKSNFAPFVDSESKTDSEPKIDYATNGQLFYYSIKPQFIKVTKEEFIKYLNGFPRPLKRDVFGVCDPPSVTYNDFELADRYPYSVVASTFLYDDDPKGHFYTPEENRVYRIMINYKEVFDSRTGNKTMN